MPKKRSELTQDQALELLRSEQMDTREYIALCDEMDWDPNFGMTPKSADEK